MSDKKNSDLFKPKGDFDNDKTPLNPFKNNSDTNGNLMGETHPIFKRDIKNNKNMKPRFDPYDPLYGKGSPNNDHYDPPDI